MSNSEMVVGRYDDSPTKLEVQLVVPGVRDKSWMKASNTQVFLKSDPKSMSCTVEIVKMDKKKKPPEKSIIDRRFYKVIPFIYLRYNFYFLKL
ncbi:hypothetical protein WR25_03924 isoform D [Diploscapter pachys]|uniref:Uncharacterized protein n=1 Tax=Diploscapter pachys TaxID=2018661 RepID=A0A2A2J1N6_9BILA|nr:hypothetical protein WR25_03924 isoform D [Diploscapter pachys]